MIDLDDIELVANKLESAGIEGPVFLGGSVIGLYLTDPLAPSTRIGTTTAKDTTNAFGEVDEFDVIPAVEREVASLQEQGTDFLIVVTQQPLAADRALLAAVPAVNLVLSEEQSETITHMETIGHRVIAKSAGNITSVVRFDIDIERAPAMTLQAIPVDAGVSEDAEVAELATQYTQLLDEHLGEAVGVSNVDLDAGASVSRVQETELGNLIADAFRASLGADLGVMNGGGIRSDCVYPAGELSLRDLFSILPFGNAVVLIEVTGQQLLDALENGVSDVENASGRFPHPSSFTYTFDSSQPAFARITEGLVGGEPLDPEATYGSFIPAGGDGYTSLAGADILVEATDGKRDVLTPVDYVRALGTVNGGSRTSLFSRPRLSAELTNLIPPSPSSPYPHVTSGHDSSPDR